MITPLSLNLADKDCVRYYRDGLTIDCVRESEKEREGYLPLGKKFWDIYIFGCKMRDKRKYEVGI